MGHGGCKQRPSAQHSRLMAGGLAVCARSMLYIVLFFSLHTMINYLSYVAVAYEHPRSHTSAEHSDSINDGHCGHCLGKHEGDAHGHG